MEKFCSAVSARQGNDKQLSKHWLLWLKPALVSSTELWIKSSCFARSLLIVVKCCCPNHSLSYRKVFHLLNFIKTDFIKIFFFKFACIGQREIDPACTRGGLDWVSGEISSPKGLSNIGTGWLGKWWSHHPLEISKRCVDVAFWDMVLWWPWQCWVNGWTWWSYRSFPA